MPELNHKASSHAAYQSGSKASDADDSQTRWILIIASSFPRFSFGRYAQLWILVSNSRHYPLQVVNPPAIMLTGKKSLGEI